MSQAFPNVSTGHIKRWENYHSRFVDDRNVDIWLPDGYTAEKKYAVLYMHDGQMLFDSSITWDKQEWGVDETMGKLLAENSIQDCIVVGIWNTPKRHLEYFPEKVFYSLSQADQQKVLSMQGNPVTHLLGRYPISDNYLKFIIEELKPNVDAHLSTLPGPEHTFIVGSSMGALISMYAICEYPDVFGGAACLSTHWPGLDGVAENPIPSALINYLKYHLPSPQNHKIYFDYGTETLDAAYKPYQLQADSVIKAGGYDDTNWLTREFPGADHSENSWRKRFDVPVLFLLKK